MKNLAEEMAQRLVEAQERRRKDALPVQVTIASECPWKDCRHCIEWYPDGEGLARVGTADYWIHGAQECQGAERRRVAIAPTGIPLDDQGKDWGHTIADEAGKDTVAELQRWDPLSGIGVYLFGNVGVGKTHLMRAMLIDAVTNHGCSGRWTRSVDLADEVRASLRPGPEGVTSEMLLIRYSSPYVLAIDDLGKEPRTDWMIGFLWNLLDRRLVKPTLLTSQYALSDLVDQYGAQHGAAISDRIAGSCRRFKLGGESWRLGKRMPVERKWGGKQ
jgi:hypothetical protein